MAGTIEPESVAARRAAILEARGRYERGEITYETFRRALDALMLAHDGDECQTILPALPAEPTAALAALDPAPAPLPILASAPTPPKWIVAFMGQTLKGRRAWRLTPSTQAVAFMGEVRLDLTTAALPAHGVIRVMAIMGTVIVAVPPGVRVAVRSAVVMGEVNALGETTAGMVGVGHEEHTPAGQPPIADLEVEVFALMANVRVVVTDGQRVSVSELVRDALRQVATGVGRGLRQGLVERPALRPGPET